MVKMKKEHYHIFVGDLSPEIETQALKDAFAPFGEISDCRVVRDPQTLKSKGYGFVSYMKRSEAEAAINAMNGQWLGTRHIRTNWATRKPPAMKTEAGMIQSRMSFDEVYNQSSPANCTVYCGGLSNGLSDDVIQNTFAPFGSIQEIRVFKDKGYAFIRFSTKEAAAHAIVAVHNTDINGQLVKCSWGKESGDISSQQVSQAITTSAQYPFTYGQQLSYWYSPSYQTTAAQLQGQYMQGVQGYPYGQFGYQQGYVGRVGLQLPSTAGAAWTGQPQLPAAVTAQGATLQQSATQPAPTIIPAYQAAAMQQFQLADEEWLSPASLLV